MRILETDKPKSWKIVKSGEVDADADADADAEEVVLSFQGVIVSKNLPPVATRV
jgi:hypothetical protein